LRWIDGKVKVNHPTVTYATDEELEKEGHDAPRKRPSMSAGGLVVAEGSGYEAKWRKGQLVLAAVKKEGETEQPPTEREGNEEEGGESIPP